MREAGEQRNPFRSEADAFRLLVIVAVAALAVIAAAALIGPGAGAIVAAALLIAAIWAIVQWLREGLAPAGNAEAPQEPPETAEPGSGAAS